MWQTSDSGKYIGLDHQIPLGENGTGLSLNEFYSSYSSTEGSNINGGTKTSGTVTDDPDDPTNPTTPSGNSVLGDVTGDKKVTVADLVKVTKYVANVKGNSIDKASADVNADGRVNVFDMVLYKEYLSGTISKFPGDKG